jgi:hypothetical protein
MVALSPLERACAREIQARTIFLLDDLKINPLRRHALAVFRQRVPDDDLQNVLARRQVAPDIEAASGDEPLEVCLPAQVDSGVIVCVCCAQMFERRITNNDENVIL